MKMINPSFFQKKRRRNILAFNFKNENRKGVIEGWTWPSYFNFGQDYNEFSICYMAYISPKKKKKIINLRHLDSFFFFLQKMAFV